MRLNVEIMEQDDVDPIEPEAQQRLLERAHGGVVGIVEHRSKPQPAGTQVAGILVGAERHEVAADLG